ncbi:unnamed protein product [Clonostachys rhizophaga]|uniref:Rhodopsin domain-containing protein n=1 Tax=Clonostachys rhizophaga TaxID=160324 RepID=A0A9N9VRI7_9HYPO|nr:unnamed protein product [Clonostachys rhizophaga]
MGWVLNATEDVNGQSKYPTIISICAVFSVLSTVVVGARVWLRSKARGLAADDWLSALSAIFAIAYSGITIAQTRYGLGLPLKLRPEPNLVMYTRVNYSGRPVYQLGISFFKIALLISYLRLIQGTHHKVYRIIIWVTIGFVFLAHLGCALALILACKPVHKSWNPKAQGTCLAPGPSFTGYAVVTIISDIVTALLPLPVLLKLQVRTSKKIGLVSIFMLGVLTTVASIMRYLQIDRIQHGDGDSTLLVLWGTIEFNIGNVVSSLPFLAPLFIRKAKDYRSKHSDDYNTPSGRNKSRTDGQGSRFSMKVLSSSRAGPVEENASETGSRENILAGDRDIVKSVTYSVKVDDASISGTTQDRSLS